MKQIEDCFENKQSKILINHVDSQETFIIYLLRKILDLSDDTQVVKYIEDCFENMYSRTLSSFLTKSRPWS